MQPALHLTSAQLTYLGLVGVAAKKERDKDGAKNFYNYLRSIEGVDILFAQTITEGCLCNFSGTQKDIDLLMCTALIMNEVLELGVEKAPVAAWGGEMSEKITDLDLILVLMAQRWKRYLNARCLEEIDPSNITEEQKEVARRVVLNKLQHCELDQCGKSLRQRVCNAAESIGADPNAALALAESIIVPEIQKNLRKPVDPQKTAKRREKRKIKSNQNCRLGFKRNLTQQAILGIVKIMHRTRIPVPR